MSKNDEDAVPSSHGLTLVQVGEDADGHPLMVATMSEGLVGTMILELLSRGEAGEWWELACGPGGWVDPRPAMERFRVLRIVSPEGKVLHDFEDDARA